MTGSCCCGAVTFELLAQPTAIYCCHCSICRRSTGVQGVAVVVVPNTAFSWRRGEALIRDWKKPDADWEKRFCGQCGSPLPGPNSAETTYVPVGLLEDTEALQVAAHIFVADKAAWFHIGDSAVQHPGPFIRGD